MMPVMGHPLISYQVERICRAKTVDHLVLATTDKGTDDSLAEWAVKNGLEVFRGSEDDVLDRFYQAGMKHNPKYAIRLTGDCPLVDPQLIDDVSTMIGATHAAYASNSQGVLFPDGLDVEVCTWDALTIAWKEARLASEREHVTPYVRKCCDEGRLKSVNLDAPADFGHLRWTVDEPSDFEVVKTVLEELYPSNPEFGWMDVLSCITRHPHLITVNSAIVRNEGYLKSLANDHKS